MKLICPKTARNAIRVKRQSLLVLDRLTSYFCVSVNIIFYIFLVFDPEKMDGRGEEHHQHEGLQLGQRRGRGREEGQRHGLWGGRQRGGGGGGRHHQGGEPGRQVLRNVELETLPNLLYYINTNVSIYYEI